MVYRFTYDHFTHNMNRWKKFIIPRLVKWNRDKVVKVLIVGAGEGIIPNFLLRELKLNAKIYCLDNYNKKDYNNITANFKDLKNKVQIVHGDMAYNLRKLDPANLQFDFIYIHGEHPSRYQLEYGALCFPLLKKHGVMAFHNYTHNHVHNNNCPRAGIDAFVDAYANNIKVLVYEWEVIFIKRKKDIKHKWCFSEYYHENVDFV